ncbi:GntR family transcriptional regulator [uncultured Nisaea sp.]|uniref:GntR family transcriptional regulator n=1 Tax=uncultured Nisaea sp. TaxID=538215 RepID=UPI0030EF35BF|tara:strand:+ start:3094 stop:3795 length:702 start_codon:yes stop_codon:yes gene_type:complete
MSEGRVEEAYIRLKERAVNFQFRPGERINEIGLSRELAVSRTPLREALNRLVTEHLIDFKPGLGFFCRELDARSVYELYELREIIELAALRKACESASDAQLKALNEDLLANGLSYVGKTVREVTERDEAFHIAIAELSGNHELALHLAQINQRIRFIRWLDMSSRVKETKGEHRAIMDAMLDRDADRAADILGKHIRRRMDQIVASVKESFSNIYMAGPEELFDRQFEPQED